MSRITISEEDLTISNNADIAENVAYVPGITSRAVDEKPTIFTNVYDFIEKYGKKPYKFKHMQIESDNGVIIAGKDEYEKSYIYAVELLTAGLPVSFQNVLSTLDYESDDSNLLKDYYTILRSGKKLGAKVFTDSYDTLITLGKASKEDNIWKVSPDNITFTATEGSNNTYNISGNITEENAVSELGLDKGYRFATSFKFPEYKELSDIPQGTKVQVAVSNGTTNDYTRNQAFESDGTLVVVLNITNSSIVTVTIAFSESDIRKYIFNFSQATLVAQNSEPAEDNNTYASIYNVLLDRWIYNIKYLTSGGYQNITDSTKDYALLKTMSMAAAVRSDVIALIDTPNESILTSYNNINKNIAYETNKPYYTIKPGMDDKYKNNLSFDLSKNRLEERTLKYACNYGPQGTYEIYNAELLSQDIEEINMCGSFGYLLSLANNVNTLNNPNYLAIAGESRGFVPHLKQLLIETTGAEQEAVQVKTRGNISLNPIIKVQNYGYCIWGNRTMFPNINTKKHPEGDLAASSFANIRVMTADVKKVIYNACQKLTFETNNLELWLKFKSEIEPTLEKMIANGALEDYELTRLVSEEKTTLSVYVKLITNYAVEDFDITVGLTDSTVEEVE